jgi:RNA polymerase sigma-70 factor (ECF subfamily)
LTKQNFKDIFLTYYNPLCNYALSIVQDEVWVEDIVQEVFLNFWNQRHTIDLTGNIKSYLFTATKNQIFESLRKDKSRNKMLEGFLTLSNQQNIQNEEQELSEWVKIDQVYSSLRHLPPKCREVFELAKLKGLTYSQIAETMQISPKTVENHMAKAFTILRDKLKDTSY